MESTTPNICRNYLPSTWASTPDTVGKRTNNGTESFHLHINAQFYARNPNIFMFLEVINQSNHQPHLKEENVVQKI
jgi:hypothetical protein